METNQIGGQSAPQPAPPLESAAPTGFTLPLIMTTLGVVLFHAALGLRLANGEVGVGSFVFPFLSFMAMWWAGPTSHDVEEGRATPESLYLPFFALLTAPVTFVVVWSAMRF